MTKPLLLLLVSIISLSFSPNDHAFHVSRWEVNYDTSSGDIQVSGHIFIDDLEAAIARTGISGLRIGATDENPAADIQIEKYLLTKLSLSAGTVGVKPVMLGKELSRDKLAVWCYLEVEGAKNISNIGIANTLLTEVYNDQKNIIDFTVDKRKKQFQVFDSKTTQALFFIK